MASFVRNSGMSNVELKDEDVQQILDTLIYDGKVDKVKDAGISIPVRFHFDRFESWVRESSPSPDARVGMNVVSGPAQLCVQTISRGTAAKRTHASALWPVPRTMPPPSPRVAVYGTLHLLTCGVSCALCVRSSTCARTREMSRQPSVPTLHSGWTPSGEQ